MAWVGISAGLALGYLLRWATVWPMAKARRRLALRDAYSPEAFGARYFTGEMTWLATRLRRVFDQHYELNPSKILPSDRFKEDLAFGRSNPQVGSRKIAEFILGVEEEFGIHFDPGEFDQAGTFKALTERIQEKLAAKPAATPSLPAETKPFKLGMLPPGMV
jgi:acyl carrier protein